MTRLLVLALALLSVCCTVTFPEPPEPVDDRVPPAKVDNLAVRHAGERSIGLSWTAPGDDGSSGTPARIDLRYLATDDPASLDAQIFTSALAVEPPPTPAAGDLPQQVDVTGLEPDTPYCFALRATDWAGNLSPALTLGAGAPVVDCWSTTGREDQMVLVRVSRTGEVADPVPAGPGTGLGMAVTDGGRVWVAGQSADGQDLLLWRFE